MLKSIRIQNLATIQDIEFDLEDGFTILTGETGAGKSIIIDGIRLVLGEKGSADIIRTGERETTIEAVFIMPKGKDMKRGKQEVLIQRKVSEHGVGKGHIDGVLVPIKKLKDRSLELVDIYGQNDHAFLRHSENQLNYLDHYAGVLALRNTVAQIAKDLKRLVRQKKSLEDREREREQRLDFLDFQIKEIEKAQLKKGEDHELHSERNILKNAERIRVLVEEALNIAYSREDSISSLFSKLQPILAELGGFDKTFEEMEETLNQFAITVDDFSDFLIKFKDRQVGSPEKLETIEDRLSQIEKLKSKYGRDIQDILSYSEKAKKEFEELQSSQEKLEDLNEKIGAKFREYQKEAQRLCLIRKKTAQKLEKEIEKEIILLGMKKAQFKIAIHSSPAYPEALEKVKPTGTEDVEFLISPNPGEELRPLRKIASGGELSRVMLALKSIGKETERLKTLIFDEIDSGIGGKTAEFVAQKLQALARQHQVLCITHLPQIASFAPHHYRIDKRVSKSRTFTHVKRLSFDERVVEIARLLAGSQITETSLKNAREMLVHNLNLKR